MNSPLNFYLLICLSVMAVHAYADPVDAVQKNEQQIDERKFERKGQSMNKLERPPAQIYPSGVNNNQQLSKDGYQKKPLTKDEKEALRRQVNEAERMYNNK